MIFNGMNYIQTLKEKIMALQMAKNQKYTKIVFTKQQMTDIEDFKKSLKRGDVRYAFEGSMLEGNMFLYGVNDIVESVNKDVHRY